MSANTAKWADAFPPAGQFERVAVLFCCMAMLVPGAGGFQAPGGPVYSFTRKGGNSTEPAKVEFAVNSLSPGLHGTLVVSGAPANHGFPNYYVFNVTKDSFDFSYFDGRRTASFNITLEPEEDSYRLRIVRRSALSALVDVRLTREGNGVAPSPHVEAPVAATRAAEPITPPSGPEPKVAFSCDRPITCGARGPVRVLFTRSSSEPLQGTLALLGVPANPAHFPASTLIRVTGESFQWSETADARSAYEIGLASVPEGYRLTIRSQAPSCGDIVHVLLYRDGKPGGPTSRPASAGLVNGHRTVSYICAAGAPCARSHPSRAEFAVSRSYPLAGKLTLSGVPQNHAGFPESAAIDIPLDSFDWVYRSPRRSTSFHIQLVPQPDEQSYWLTVQASTQEAPVIDLVLTAEVGSPITTSAASTVPGPPPLRPQPASNSSSVDFGRAGRPASGERWKTALAALAGAPLFNAAGTGAGRAGAVAFRQLVRVYRSGSGGRVLIKVDGSDQWGWMSETDLCGESALRVSEKNPANQLVLLRRSESGRGLLPELQPAPAVEFQDAPGPAAAKLGRTGSSGPFYVFSRRRVAGVEYLLAGLQSVWNPSRPEASIKGWIPEPVCIHWDGKLALSYAQDNLGNRPKVVLFKYKSAAERFSRDATIDHEVAIAREAETYTLTATDGRFPILQLDGCCMKVAYAPTHVSRPLEGVAAARTRQLRDTQVLVLVNGTSKMKRFAGAIQDAIKEARKRAGRESPLHVALAVYRESRGTAAGEELIANFDDERRYGKLGSALKDANRRFARTNDAMTRALQRFALLLNWKPSSTKVILVVGDHASHTVGQGSLTAQAYSAAESLDSTAGKPGSGHTVLYVLDLVDSKMPSPNDGLLAQTDAIARNMRYGWSDGGPAGMGGRSRIDASGGGPKLVKAAIRGVLDAAVDASRSLSDVAGAAIYEGQCALAAGRVTPILGVKACDFLMDSVKIQVSPDVVDLGFEEAWVPLSAKGVALVQPWVWLSRMEVYSLTGVLSAFFQSAQSPGRAAEGFTQAALSLVGVRLAPDETLAAWLERVYRIGVAWAPMLEFTPGALQEKLEADGAFHGAFLRELGRSLELLSLAGAEQSVDVPLTWDSGVGRWLRPRPEQIPVQKRWASVHGSEMFGWLPLTLFPGGARIAP